MRLGVFIDGDNISSAFAEEIRARAFDRGHPAVARVYGNSMTVLRGWESQGWLRPVYAGGGKNASDLLLGLDAVDFMHTTSLDTILVVSSDGDFYHLATKTREMGRRVIGVGMPNAPKRYRDACTEFHALAGGGKGSQIDRLVRSVIEDGSTEGSGIALKTLGAKMGQVHKVSIKTMPEKTWRRYLENRADKFTIDHKDGEDIVHFLKSGFGNGGE